MTTVTDATQPGANQPTKTQQARNKLGETYDHFLKLLTTQLKHQDPLNPMDSTEFTNQLVLYSQVEQQIGQNEKLEKLLKSQETSLTLGALGYIGLDVEVADTRFSLTEGGSTTFAYTLPQDAHAAQIRIVDSQGQTVHLMEAEKKAGRHEVTWDGKNVNGTHVPAGNYRFEVIALDAEQNPIAASPTVFGRVTGIEHQLGETTILIGDTALDVGRILSARRPPASAVN